MDIKKLNEELSSLAKIISEQGEEEAKEVMGVLGKIKQKLIKAQTIFELNYLVAMIEHIFAKNGLSTNDPLEDGEFSFFRTRQMAITYLKEVLEGAVEAIEDPEMYRKASEQAYAEVSRFNVPKIEKWMKHFMKIVLKK